MAKTKPNSLLESISGKLSKSDDIVIYHKFGKTYAWRNKGVHTFTPAQIANQSRFGLAVQAYNDLVNDPARADDFALYRQAFAAQSQYVMLRQFIIAQMMAEMKEA